MLSDKDLTVNHFFIFSHLLLILDVINTHPFPTVTGNLLSQPEEIDEELMGWLQEAAEFARKK